MGNFTIETKTVERWGVFTVAVPGKSDGNPFVDYEIRATFTGDNEEKTVDGFYDGDGVYKVHFMPSFVGTYRFKVFGTYGEGCEGAFDVIPPAKDNHGPLYVNHHYHFAYADGTPYYSIGTTCYVWHLQTMELQEQTLETLKNSAFNKIRFCVFPKHYDYNFNEPYTYPYEGTPCDNSGLTRENFKEYELCAPGNDWDYMRFNPEHFRHLERRVQDLMDLGIEADLIVMHPYDRWGFSCMTKEQDDLYWKYLIARLSAYRNVWWALANEYDLMPWKSTADWERYADIICEKDVYRRLRSIHNCKKFYDHSRPWITHCSIQRTEPYLSGERVAEWREIWKKPVVLDEIIYEGDIELNWGNINGQELTRRFWEATVRGGYAGHGETFLCPERILWWSHGGTLKGTSPERFKFLLNILKETPGPGLMPFVTPMLRSDIAATVENRIPDSNYYLIYYGRACPSFKEYYFDDTTEFRIEVIDTWNMTIEDIGVQKGKLVIPLPAREYMAVRLRPAN